MESSQLRKSKVMLYRKIIGPSFFVPLIGLALTSFYTIIISLTSEIPLTMESFRSYFGVFTFPSICIWIFSMYENMVEGEGKESLLSLPYQHNELGIMRVLKLFGMYTTAFYICFFLTFAVTVTNIMYLEWIDFILPILSILFLSGLSFFLIVFTKNTLISYGLFCLYCSFHYLTRGAFSFAIYPFHWSLPKPYTNDIIVIIWLIVFSLVLFAFAQQLFSKREFLLK